MKFYLLPHHRLDPRFRYTLEREPTPDRAGGDSADRPNSWWKRLRLAIQAQLRRLREDYDHIVHGHEQMRLSRLLILMDRDPELTIVVPKGMPRDWALAAVRGVIQAGLMAHRSYVARNIATAAFVFLILFLVIPYHVPALLFLPLIALYAWRRHREDLLIRSTMTHLLQHKLAGDGHGMFLEDEHLARLEEEFARTANPSEGYRHAVEYLDALDQRIDGKPLPELELLFKYYRDIGRLDPYERYQDRLRKRLRDAIATVWSHLKRIVATLWRYATGWIRRGEQLSGQVATASNPQDAPGQDTEENSAEKRTGQDRETEQPTSELHAAR